MARAADPDAPFAQFVREHGSSLRHAAALLTGDHHAGEDFTQTVLTKMYLRWSRIDTGVRDGSGQYSGQYSEVDARDQLRRTLARLSPRDRAIVVLRYYADQSEAQTAQLLGLPLGTVKSATSRALAALRVAAVQHASKPDAVAEAT